MRTVLTIVCVSVLAVSCSPFLDSGQATFESSTSSGSYELSAYLKAEKPEENAWFGYIVGAHNGLVTTSAPFETVNGASNAGAAYVFEPLGGDWTKKRVTLPNAEAGDGNLPNTVFPHEVPPVGLWGAVGPGLSDDLLMIALPADDSKDPQNPFDNSAPQSGAVYSYELNDLEAEPQYIKATPQIEAGDLFGFTVRQSADWVMIGAPGDDAAPGAGWSDNSAPDSGALYVFRRRGGGLVFESFEKPEGLRSGDFFGSGVAVSGKVMAVGAFTQDATDSNGTEIGGHGSVYVYGLKDDRWLLESQVRPEPPQNNAFFGSSLAISDGVLAVGASGWTGCSFQATNTAYRGAVFIATRKEADWSIDQCLAPRSEGPPSAFGWRVAMFEDKLVVGAILDSSGSADDPYDVSKSNSGAVYVFQRDASGQWIDRQYLKAPNPDQDDLFGFWVAITPGLIAVGAPRESGAGTGLEPDQENGATQAGALYIFREVAEP